MTMTTHQPPTDDAVFKSGGYTGRDGKKRNRYEAIGVAWRNDDGQIARVKLTAIPLAWDGNLYFRAKATASGEAV